MNKCKEWKLAERKHTIIKETQGKQNKKENGKPEKAKTSSPAQQMMSLPNLSR